MYKGNSLAQQTLDYTEIVLNALVQKGQKSVLADFVQL